MPSQKKQIKAKATTSATASAAVKSKSNSKSKTKAGNQTTVISYTGLISNNGDFSDYFWNQPGSSDQDNISMAVNHGSEDDFGQGGHPAEDNFSGQGSQ